MANANDTNATIAQIVKPRADRARLLGFASHAHWRMQDTMARTPERAQALMMRVWPAAVARVREEVRDQQAIARRLGHNITIEPWDYRYYMEKVRRDRFNLSQDELKPYFELSNMINGMFYMAERLYGLHFTENTGQVPVWHPDIRTWRVTDRDGRDVGIFYGDMFARTGKRSGAWATTYRSRSGLLGDRIVLGSNNNNFTKPGPGEPVLISLDDAETLFHEFGHAIHYFLSNVHYPSLGGTPRDFVEYPSQVHENWVLTPRDPEPLRAPLPDPPADAAGAGRADRGGRSTFNQGFATVEYLSSALVDMALHIRPDGVVDPDAFERETLTRLGMPREIVMRHRLPQFNHLFSSDAYSAGYYSYLWSETMDADTWAAFEESGNVWDPATAQRFAQHPALDRQRDRPRRSLSRLPRPRPGRQRAAQAARLPDELSACERSGPPCPGGLIASSPSSLAAIGCGLDQQVELVLAAILDQRRGDRRRGRPARWSASGR